MLGSCFDLVSRVWGLGFRVSKVGCGNVSRGYYVDLLSQKSSKYPSQHSKDHGYL